MRRILVALLLAACAGAPAIERPPTTTRAAVVPYPAKAPSASPTLPRTRELPFDATRIFAGAEPNAEHAEGTLLMLIDTGDTHRLDELDIATMHPFRSLDFGSDELTASDVRSGSLYLLTSSSERGQHTLRVIDLAAFSVRATTHAPQYTRSQRVDHVAGATVEIGTKGVLVFFRDDCPAWVPETDRVEGCVFFETHRLGDLSIMKMRIYSHLRRMSFPFPPPVPDDAGHLDEETSQDRPKPAHCETHGELFRGSVWVGDNYFELLFGCCGGARGGLFQCRAPE